MEFHRVASVTTTAGELFPRGCNDRRIRLTCLHPCCHPIQTKWRFIWEVTSLRSWRDSWAGERGGGAAIKSARDFASGEAVSEINGTLHQSSHGFATLVHGFATKTKALTREIPPATQARKLQLLCLYILSCTQLRVTNCTIVTSQMNHHVVWIGWQQGCIHASQIRLLLYFSHSNNTKRKSVFFKQNESARLVTSKLSNVGKYLLWLNH